MAPVQVSSPAQEIVAVAAFPTIVPAHEDGPAQDKTHAVPAQRMFPEHEWSPVHATSQPMAPEQSTSLSQADAPQVTRQGIPDGHLIASTQEPGAEQSKAHAPAASQAPPARAQVVHAFDRAAPPVPSTCVARPPSPPVPDPPAAIPPAEGSGPRPPPVSPNGLAASIEPPRSASDESPVAGAPAVPNTFAPPPLPIPLSPTVLPAPPALVLKESPGIPRPAVPLPAPFRLKPDRSTRHPVNAITARNPLCEVRWSACLIAYYSRRYLVSCQSPTLRGQSSGDVGEPSASDAAARDRPGNSSYLVRRSDGRSTQAIRWPIHARQAIR
jgi:hypothetical protein